MRKICAQIFVTNVPSFYKLNLYNEINKKQRVLAVFTDDGDPTRNADFYKGSAEFESVSLSGRPFLSKAAALLKIIFFCEYKMLVLGGWNSALQWICAFASPRRKNALALESSIFESTVKGWRGFLKRIFLSRVSKVFASGKMHKKLLDALEYRGEVAITKGVGIYNIVDTPPFAPKSEIRNFIYVGRFIPCKNLENLVEAFKKFPDCTLTMVGYGELEAKLRAAAPKNVKFVGAVENARLPDYYRQNDVFILPSFSEPWGVVVEEALNNGLPVIISENVGCNGEAVEDGVNGAVFKFSDKDPIARAIRRIREPEFYNKISQNIRKTDFREIAGRQIDCYLA